MKNSITHCPPRTNTFSKDVLGFMKTLLMLITFIGLSQFVIAQTPACNIEGILQGCAITDPDETRNDIEVVVTVAQSGHNPTLVYDIPAGSNQSGAFIRSFGDTIYDGDFNSLTQTLFLFPGTSDGGFLLTLKVKNNESGDTNSCSKSVTVFRVTVDATYDPILCFGGTTTLNVTGTSAPVSPMTFTVSPDGGVKNDNSNPYSVSYPGLTGTVAGKVYSIEAKNSFGCVATTERTIFEPAENPVVTNCPNDTTIASCLTQEAIDAAFAAWLAEFSTSGGTNSVVKTNPETLPTSGPDKCGGEISITWTVSSDCEDDVVCTKTFTVGAGTSLEASCPGDTTLPACTSSEDILAAYNDWKSKFGVSGGCSPTSNIAEIPGLPEKIACGGEISFTLIAQNGDGTCPGRDECTSKFGVATSEGVQISLTCADDKEIACTDEVSFDEPTPSGGCGTVTVEIKGEDVEVTNPDGTTSVTRTWEATDACGNKAECSQKVTKTCCASIGDLVWKDDNNNGIQDAGEVGVPNVTVTLYTCGDNTVVTSQSTDGDGKYLFTNLCAGRYYVKFSDIPSGYVFSTKDAGSDDCKDSDADGTTGNTDCISLAEGESNLCVDAGVKPPVEYWGCTPGYWKTHPAIWDQASDPISACIAAAAAGLGYGGNGTTGTLFRTTFGLTAAQMTAVGYNPNMTLLQAASLGGGGFQKLARHGVSSLLNTCGITEHFPVNAQYVLTTIHDAVINKTPEPLATLFAGYNEQDPDICPPGDNQGQTKALRVPGEEVVREESTILVFPTPASTMVNIDMIFNSAKEAVTLEIYNVNGQRLAVLFNSSADADFEYHTEYNVSTLPSGAYFYRLSADGETKMGKLSVVR